MRNVWLLTLAQAFAACGTIMLVTFGGIVGTELAPSAVLATLPVSISIFGVASTSLPAALLMQRIGRKRAFVGSALIAALAALGMAASIALHNFWTFCASAYFIGANMAFVQQYRFAAVEFVAPALAGRAVSTVMLGTLAAALVGPFLGQTVAHVGDWPEFTATYVALSALCVTASLILTRLPDVVPPPRSDSPAEGRSLSTLLRVPDFRLAVLCGLASYAVMSFIMTATPLSMHVHDGFATADTTRVITAHLLGMYLPSLAAPLLVRVLGVRAMMLLGVAANLACVGISAMLGHAFVHYFVGLVLLGLGWNLMFVAATTLLTSTYTPQERFRAQGFNDLVVFGSQATASLLAGTAIEKLGWESLNIATLPLLALVIWAIVSRSFSKFSSGEA